MIEYLYRDLHLMKTAHKREDRSRYYLIVFGDFAKRVITKWKQGFD